MQGSVKRAKREREELLWQAALGRDVKSLCVNRLDDDRSRSKISQRSIIPPIKKNGTLSLSPFHGITCFPSPTSCCFSSPFLIRCDRNAAATRLLSDIATNPTKGSHDDGSSSVLSGMPGRIIERKYRLGDPRDSFAGITEIISTRCNTRLNSGE